MTRRTLEAIVTTASPLHVAAFEPFDPFPYGMDKDKEAAKTIKTIKGQWSARYLSNRKQAVDAAEGETGRTRRQYPAKVPCFPANDMRGRMRRAAAHKIMEQVGSVDLPMFQILTTGALPGGAQEGSGYINIPDRIREMEDVYLGSFGGGKNMTPSTFSVGDLLPIVKRTGPGHDNMNAVPHDVFEYSKENSNGEAVLCHVYRMTSRDDILRGSNDTTRIIDWENETAQYVSEQQSNNAKRKNKDDESDAKKKDRNLVFGAEAIIPGVPMYLRIDLSPSMSDAQVGLVIASLKSVLSAPIGGLSRIGFGRLTVNEVRLTIEGGEPVSVLGTNEYEEAMTCALQSLTLDGLRETYGLNKDAKDAKKAKKAAGAEA